MATVSCNRLDSVMLNLFQHPPFGIFDECGMSDNRASIFLGARRLAYVESCDDTTTAISREKQLKRRHRDWKINLIERDDPHWLDLAHDLGLA